VRSVLLTCCIIALLFCLAARLCWRCSVVMAQAVKFCGPACAKRAWNSGHKAACAVLKRQQQQQHTGGGGAGGVAETALKKQ
jgi:hypothetical protein